MIAEKALVLTKSGWRNVADVNVGDELATLNGEGFLVYHPVTEVKKENYDGHAVRFHGKNLEQLTTPDHRFLLENRQGKQFYSTSGELLKYRSNKWKVLKKCKWVGEEMETFKLDGATISNRAPEDLRDAYSKDVEIPAEVWFRFMGWYLSEGSTLGTGGSERKGNVVKVTQAKDGDNKQEIRDVMTSMPFENYREFSPDGRKVDFIITDARLRNYLLPLGNSHIKYVPSELKRAPIHLLKIMFDAFMKGDGRDVTQGDKGQYKKQSVFSTSRQLINDMQEILMKIGGCGNISEWQPNDRIINEWKDVVEEVDSGSGPVEVVTKKKIAREIKAENSHLQFNLNIASTEYIYLDNRMMSVDKMHHKGMMYDFKTAQGNYCVMYNHKVHWIGGME